MKLFKNRTHSNNASAGAPVRQPAPKTDPSSTKANRREILRAVLHETLERHGIPAEWIRAELLASTLGNGEDGLHWRLQLRRWEPKLLQYVVALEDALLEQLVMLDPTAERWLTGMSWQFAIKDRSQCPPLPSSRAWAGRKAAQEHGPQADVENARADLNRWLSKHDSQFPRSPEALPPTWAPTQPAKIR